MKNMNAVVTGGTRGIGLAIAESLVKHGASVALVYGSDDEAADEAVRRIKSTSHNGVPVTTVKGDVGDAKAVAENYRRVREELGPVQVLVNNAGIMQNLGYSELTAEDWNRTIAVNLNGAFYWSSEVVPDMKNEGFGRIVNIASIAARGGGLIGPHYAASKAGMLGLTRYAAKELGSFGITVRTSVLSEKIAIVCSN